ncbi:DUF2345 domain-containing protein, partial [Ralstonia sp. UBA689]|uniref:DUF2345 domain-containing protein n=1 Tax=Ralstonia sp. UBA689 TaxID=1947373 RepID=UPI0025D9CA14
GIKLVAASGKVHIEAQRDEMELVAERVLKLMSTKDWIDAKAKQGIRLNGGGSVVEISAEGVVVYTAGKHEVHAASHQTLGPQSKGAGFPPVPQAGPGQLELLRQYVSGEPVKGSAFTVTDSLGAQHKGTLDASGRALVSGLSAGAVAVSFGHDPHDPWAQSSALRQPRWMPEGAESLVA